MQRFVIALVLGSAVYFMVREIMKYLSAISGTRSAAISDLLALDELVDAFELAPWQLEEVDLISRNHEVQSRTEMHAYVDYGCFYSIYEEPIMAFATKDYKKNERRLIVVKFNNTKYHFNIFGPQIEMTVNRKPHGKISLDEGLRLDLRGSIASIEDFNGPGLIPLSLNDKEILGIATDDDLTGNAGRMLRKLSDYSAEQGELILLSLSFALANKQI